MPIRVDGELWDIPDAVRHFDRYTPDQRANLMASHRTGYRRKHAVGEFFWTHEYCPNIAFPTRKAARMAALESLGRKEIA